MNTILLDELYKKYDIENLAYGKIHDKLGDVYEEYCILILSNSDFLAAFQKNEQIDSVEFEIFKSLLTKAGINNILDIAEITATNIVPHRKTHGNAKTDVIATIIYKNGTEMILPISIKQSYVAKVAVAEFDIDTICNEAGIDNDRVRELMRKFQTAKSAKGLTAEEQAELREAIAPYARKLVRWAITGSSEENPNSIVFPKLLVKFKISKPKDRYDIKVCKGELNYLSHSIYTINEYIDLTIYDKKGNIKKGGFGTGLSWTYASGSGGRKIQFKA